MVQKTEIDKEFERLTADIRQFESIRTVHDDREEFVSKALEWLRQRQHPEGFWGEQCMLDTQLSLLALGMWSRSTREWVLPTGELGGIEPAYRWLDRFQSDGAWDNNIWDTSAILQSAAVLDMLDRRSIQKAKAWIESREYDNWGLDKGYGAHYISQALIAMVACRSPVSLIAKARNALWNEARKLCEQDTGTPYIDGQVISALIIAGINPADQYVSRIGERLKNFLFKADVTISNWMHLCSAFRGLGLAIGSASLEHPTVQFSIQRLFSPNRLRIDGSWYRDVTMTGWALIALDSVRTVRKIDGYSYQIFTSVERTKRNVISIVGRERRQRLLILVYGLMLPFFTVALIILIAAFLSTNKMFPISSDLIFFLIPILLGCISFIAVRIKKLLFG